MLQKISIVLIGENHCDPLAIEILHHAILNAHQENIPIVMCEEDFIDQTLANKLEGLQQLASIASTSMQNHKIAALLQQKKGLRFKYFLSTDHEKIAVILNEAGYRASSGHVANYVRRYLNVSENLKLTHTLIKHNICYQGIDYGNPEERHRSMEDVLHYISIEKSRIETMAQTIITHAIPMLAKQNGLIFVKLGINHLHNLAAALQSNSTHPLASAQVNMKVFPIKIFSPYGFDKPDIQKAMEINLDGTPAFKKAYQELICNDLLCTDDPGNLGLQQFQAIMMQAKQFTAIDAKSASSMAATALKPQFSISSPLSVEEKTQLRLDLEHISHRSGWKLNCTSTHTIAWIEEPEESKILEVLKHLHPCVGIIGKIERKRRADNRAISVITCQDINLRELSQYAISVKETATAGSAAALT